MYANHVFTDKIRIMRRAHCYKLSKWNTLVICYIILNKCFNIQCERLEVSVEVQWISIFPTETKCKECHKFKVSLLVDLLLRERGVNHFRFLYLGKKSIHLKRHFKTSKRGKFTSPAPHPPDTEISEYGRVSDPNPKGLIRSQDIDII